MSLLGVHLALLAGPVAPLPAPKRLMESLESVEVTHTDQGRSGFQIVFQAGRSGPLDLFDDPLLLSPQLRVLNRVLLVVQLNVRPRILMDGIITHQELAPGDAPGMSRLTVTGEDVSVMMDLEEESAAHPAQPDAAIVAKLIARYARYGLTPVVIPPKVIDPPLPVERIPVQQGTDLSYIEELARRHGHVFYVTPGPLPLQNRAYWGPPRQISVPQKALSVDNGTATNVDSVDFTLDALAPERVDGEVMDRRTHRKMPVRTVLPLRVPLSRSQPRARVSKLREITPGIASAFGRAQGRTDLASDRTAVARGRLDAIRYGELLQARGLVGLRGAGQTYDGLWYVQEVTHSIRPGAYTQSFTLTRDGVGTTVPGVRP